MSAPDSIHQLVEKFDRDKPDSETEVRIQFVDPLFSALGWDMRDKRQVRHEPSVTVQEAGLERSKYADYSFHIGNTRHFFVETKMPHINLERNTVPAFQLRRYGWSGGTPVSVLTDFEEFCVYDCRLEPNQKDPADKARLRYWTFQNYIDDWDEIEARFSREAVAQGALREWVEGKRVRGILSVDQSFLGKMEEWRELLAKDIALHNRDLSQRQLNLLVQRTIDRIVFLRIAEDRDIESYRRLRSAASEGKQVYEELKRLFVEADDKYNSGLFHFSDEKRASEPDRDSLKIHIPDEPLRQIIKNLYFPFSPFEFTVMPPEILGQVYEQFLGKVIELSPGGAVRVEEKPEVRKAGGVYYTPTYIVDYIVENTVGALLEGKTPADAAKLRILDPACGSGSFLVGAYQYLLDWHLESYSREPDKHKNVLRRIVGGYVLTTAEKRRILQNNIYGVDLDQNAVEVSKLSLLLKMLENESDAAGRQTLMFAAGGRILPDLSNNIKWGNSLIGSDFFRGPQASLFADEEAMLKVKAFDWDSDAGFGDIMAAGGFDAVIGNPPYVRQEILGKDFKDYAKKKYETYHGVADLYTYFIEQAHRILKSKGVFAMICSNKFMRARYGTALRNYLSKKVKIREIVDFGELPVFESASTFPAIIITSRQLPAEQRFLYAAIKRLDFSTLLEEVKLQGSILDSRSIANNNWTLARSEEIEIMEKMQKIGLPLDSYVGGSIHYGIKTGRNDAFVIDEYVRQSLIEQDIKSEEIIKPFLIGRDVYGYKDLQLKRYVIFTRRGTDIEKYQAIKAYLQQFRTLLEPKPKGWKGTWQGRKPGTYKWYEIQDTVDYHYEFTKPKIIYPVIAKEPRFTIDTKGFYSNDKTFIIPNANLYLLGLLNSKLAWLYLKRTCSVLGDPDKRGRLELRDIYVRTLPIRTIDFDNPEDVKMHDEMVALVDDMLDRHKQLPGLMGEGRKIAEALIQRVDNEIDALVYRLYGLSEDEVAVVEGR